MCLALLPYDWLLRAGQSTVHCSISTPHHTYIEFLSAVLVSLGGPTPYTTWWPLDQHPPHRLLHHRTWPQFLSYLRRQYTTSRKNLTESR